MEAISISPKLKLIPYYDAFEISLPWYQDLELCRQVDNIDHVYDLARLQAMYHYLSSHGDCYYICYEGQLVGDVTLRENCEISIVICQEYQNLHLGRQCVAAMIDLAREKGYPEVKANIYSFNNQSQKMFLAAGFVPCGEEWYTYSLS